MQKLIVIVALLLCYSSNSQTPDSTIADTVDEIEPYDYDTVLKGGYTILFKADDTLLYLFLKKENKIITELSSCSRGLLYKNLGYVTADFNHYFVLTHSFGSGNPHYIELIKKVNGENILNGSAAWIDAIEEKEMLLYCEEDVPTPRNKMTLLNIKTGKKQYFNFPTDIFGEPQVLNRMSIEKLTEQELVLKYETKKGEKKKVYRLYQK
jgi:hypothetical protein